MEENDSMENELNSNELVSEDNATDGAQVTGEQGQDGEVAKLQEELAASKDKYIRLYSEFENFRRRTAKEKIDLAQNANEQVIKSLLPIVDDFERADKSIQDKSNKDIEGYILIYNKLKKLLEQYNVKTMDLSAGSNFDADLHEAITQVPADEKLKGKIVDVVEKGYLLNDKVIRFAKVVIGS